MNAETKDISRVSIITALREVGCKKKNKIGVPEYEIESYSCPSGIQAIINRYKSDGKPKEKVWIVYNDPNFITDGVLPKKVSGNSGVVSFSYNDGAVQVQAKIDPNKGEIDTIPVIMEKIGEVKEKITKMNTERAKELLENIKEYRQKIKNGHYENGDSMARNGTDFLFAIPLIKKDISKLESMVKEFDDKFGLSIQSAESGLGLKDKKKQNFWQGFLELFTGGSSSYSSTTTTSTGGSSDESEKTSWLSLLGFDEDFSEEISDYSS
jgi:ribosomal protein L22